MLALLLFSSLHCRSGNWDGHARSFIFCFVTNVCVDFVRSLSWWKIQPWPFIRFLAEGVRFRLFYLFIFDRIRDAMYLNKKSRTSNWKNMPTTLRIQRYIKLYTWGTFYPCVHQTHLVCLLPKSSFFLVSSDQKMCRLKFQSCLTTEYAGVCFWMSEENFSWNPLKQHQLISCTKRFKVQMRVSVQLQSALNDTRR